MKQDEIARLLPGVFQVTVRPGNPLFALLEVMETMHAPPAAVLDRLDAVFDPRRTMDRFVPFLAEWVDLDRLFERSSRGTASDSLTRSPISTGLGRLRELIAAAAYLSQWRGTAKGLCRFLEIATGTHGFTVDESVRGPDGHSRPFHVRIHAPEATARHRDLIERVIESEKPAYVTYELEFTP
jgi:phage tail-like protein